MFMLTRYVVAMTTVLLIMYYIMYLCILLLVAHMTLVYIIIMTRFHTGILYGGGGIIEDCAEVFMCTHNIQSMGML